MRTADVLAPAKVNLTLHVTGRRADGYHLIDSLVAFAPVADRLTLTVADEASLTVTGPEAGGVPTDGSNLVRRAAEAVTDRPVAIRLDKRLPAAAGIGGGSSDAAAVVRGLQALGLAGAGMERLAALGADVPMCLSPTPVRARGIGERLTFVALAPLPAVLANPRVPVPTAEVFRALASPDGTPMPETLPDLTDRETAIDWLAAQRNDLEAPARAVAPEVGAVLAALARLPGARLVRMSGSGATCFALFDDEAAAEAAAGLLAAERPGWWIAAGALGDQSVTAAPELS